MSCADSLEAGGPDIRHHRVGRSCMMCWMWACPAHRTTRTPSGSSWCARRTPAGLKGETSHAHVQQWVWCPDKRSRARPHMPVNRTTTLPVGATRSPTATGGHQTGSSPVGRAAGISASHSGMKPQIANRRKWKIHK